MLRHQVWRPANCDCVVNEVYDDEDPELRKSYVAPEQLPKSARDQFALSGGHVIATATGKEVVESVGDCHKGLSGDKLYAKLLEECRKPGA